MFEEAVRDETGMLAGGKPSINLATMARVEAYIALGSNLGDRAANLRAGLTGLAARGLAASAESSVWETEAVDTPEPLAFLNLVVRAVTMLGPLAVLDRILEVERELGRIRSVRNAPRVLDLDLLLLGDLRCDGPRLVLPHPRMWERRFVLEPLAEIAPGMRDPRSGCTVSEACQRLPRTHAVHALGRLGASLRASGV